MAVGDIMLDTRLTSPRIFYHIPSFATSISGAIFTSPLPYTNVEHYRDMLVRQGVFVDDISDSSHVSKSQAIEIPQGVDVFNFPFTHVRNELLQSDFVFGNLECPLAMRGRPVRNEMCYCASPDFAAALAAANFKVMSFSNNHSMDYGELAFLDTIETLQRNGILAVGAGKNYEDARKPIIIEIRGTRFAFLAYNLIGPEIVYALPDESGVIPLNDLVVKEDIERVRDKADIIIASIHWGTEEKSVPSKWLVNVAHNLIDIGIDVILGHHPHIPGSIEIYKSKPIIYSLGNFIFGHSHHHWGDNIMIKLVLFQKHIQRIEMIPIGGRGREQFQPILLSGRRAKKLMNYLSHISKQFATPIAIKKDRGVVYLNQALRELDAQNVGLLKRSWDSLMNSITASSS